MSGVITINHRPERRPASRGRDGVLVMLPLLAGYAPFGLAVGAAVAAHGDPLAGWAGSWIVYGGSAHLATLHTLETVGLVAAILAGAVVNVRLLVYSASLAQRWVGQPLWFRLTAAPLVIDPTWAVTERRPHDEHALAAERRFFFGASLTLGIGWSVMIAVGAVAGNRIDATHLLVAVPICLASMVGDRLRDRRLWRVGAAAGLVAVVASDLPAGTGVLLAIIAGCLAGSGRSDGQR